MNDVVAALSGFFSKSKLPVLFAGAGVSSRAGLPTWGAYLAELGAAAFEYDEYTKFIIDRAIRDGALGDAAAYYMMCRQMPEATKLRELARPLETFDAQALSHLVALPFRSVVTTNFDRALFAAYAKYSKQAVQEVNIDDPTLDAAAFCEDLYIARIHGRVEVPASMRLATAALADLEKNASYQRYLEHIFSRRQVLFLGFSFLDPAIQAVLRAVRSATKSMHRQEHLALVPKGASAEFLLQLELHSIRRMEYDDGDHHSALWDGIQTYAAIYKRNEKEAVDVREQPFSVAKKYLATAFARSRVGKQREPLAQAIAEGVVSGVVQASGELGVSEQQLIMQLQEDLSLKEDAATSLVAQSVVALARAGVCKIELGTGVPRYFPANSEASAYDSAISRLSDGSINRYILLEKGKDSAPARLFLKELYAQLLLTRGWELGAAFAARKMPENVSVSDVADEIKDVGLKPSEVRGLIRSVESLVTRPDDEEVELLAELGRTAFGLELLLEAPHDPVFLQRTLPERIYFDANVIMPAITPGHPHYQLFNETISSLRKAAGTAILDVSLRVYDGFLNEIVSHRNLAREAMDANGGEGAMWEARAVGLYGSGNVNVFVGAYFNYVEAHAGVSFEEFLHVAAPYNNEADLRRHIEKLGFQVIRDNQANKYGMPEILHSLEKFYANKLEVSRKSPVVVRHDAAQLAIIYAELREGIRTMFVSADRGIRFALEYEGHSNISNSMMTHLGLTQLVELLIGRLPASRGLASLLWMSPVSNDTDRIRNYLINLGLREHDAALAMGMSEIVSDVSEDAGMELSRKRLRLDSENESDRIEINHTLERYEASFFQKMKAAADKIRGRG
ncbi:SIR2 family protein [Frateuria sp. GZRe14]|uniref:SIR2 family protein n=1 Tax=Frateuria sp. GZRe14 TaxID=3351534 RepID=UPI003EDC67A7